MQKWARLNIRRLRGLTARRKTSGAEQLTAQVAARNDYQQVHPEVLQQRIENATDGKMRLQRRQGKTNRILCQTQV